MDSGYPLFDFVIQVGVCCINPSMVTQSTFDFGKHFFFFVYENETQCDRNFHSTKVRFNGSEWCCDEQIKCVMIRHCYKSRQEGRSIALFFFL